jgi:hypothetical protein
MDSSNSQTNRPVDYLLGAKYTQQQFTQQDWAMLLGEMIEDAKSQLKYLSAMRPPEEIFNRKAHRQAFHLSRRKFEKLVGRPLIECGKCLILCAISFDPRIKPLIKTPRPETLPFDFFLFLTVSGELFLVFVTYKHVNGSTHPATYITENVIAVPVSLKDLDLTRETSKSRPDLFCVATEMMSGLYYAFKKTINDRLIYLSNLKQTSEEMRRTMKQLDVFSCFDW